MKKVFFCVFLTIISLALLAQNQNKTETWPLEDRSAIAGFLFNPGSRTSFNILKKRQAIQCYYDNEYLKTDSVELSKRVINYFNFFSLFVLNRENGIFDSARVYFNDLNGKKRYAWVSRFAMNKLERDATAKLVLLSRALVPMVDMSIQGSVINMKFDIDKLPVTKIPFDKRIYFTTLSFVIKDFVCKGNNDFSTFRAYFKEKGQTQVNTIDLTDGRAFSNMYNYKFYHPDEK